MGLDSSTLAWSWFTFVPSWFFQDLIVLLLAAAVIAFILRHDKHPGVALLEFAAFVFLYAGVYENFATVVGLYRFGRSFVMLFNVPISVPILEFLVVYASLRLGRATRLPVWTLPVFAGGMGILMDLVLDPLALSQRANTNEGVTGRWSWLIQRGDVNVFGAPIYNYSGWMLLCGLGAAFLLLGRWWFRRSGENPLVGAVYPVLSMLAALVALVCLGGFALWLAPFYARGGMNEYAVFVFWLAAFLAVVIAWRGRMRRRLDWRSDWAVPLVFAALQGSNLVFLVLGGRWQILALAAPVIAIQWALAGLAFVRARSLPPTPAAPPPALEPPWPQLESHER